MGDRDGASVSPLVWLLEGERVPFTDMLGAIVTLPIALGLAVRFIPLGMTV